ncbi:MAG: RNase H family protein [Myxococcota bacterium]
MPISSCLFPQELQSAAEQLVRASSPQFELSILTDSWREYSLKLQVHAQQQNRGILNLYYSPKRKAFTLRTHQVRSPKDAQSLEQIWQELQPVQSLPSNAGSLVCHAEQQTQKPPRAEPETDKLHTQPTLSEQDVASQLSLFSSLQLYVDGSYIRGKIGYGLVILTPDERILHQGSGAIRAPDLQQQRQVSGELIATQYGLLWCAERNIQHLDIFYDYIGIEKWATGGWRAKQNLTQTYKEFVRACPLKITWHKVASHTGNTWNEYVDHLAKKGTDALEEGTLLTCSELSR